MIPRVLLARGADWREIVRGQLGLEISVGYNDFGAPVLAGAGAGYIGVSHTAGWVAVAFSSRPCAVDIELFGREVSAAVVSRFAGFVRSKTGFELPLGHNLSLLHSWCGLEAAYKFWSVSGFAPLFSSLRFDPHPQLVVAVVG